MNLYKKEGESWCNGINVTRYNDDTGEIQGITYVFKHTVVGFMKLGKRNVAKWKWVHLCRHTGHPVKRK